MYKIKKIGHYDLGAETLWAIQSNPQLWDENPERTAHPDSPHHNLHDIWVRFSADKKADVPHDSVWYPSADILGLKPLVYDLCRAVEAEILGGVLLTKIPAGETCKKHIDKGWHADKYRKFAIQIQSAPGQIFHVDDESLEARPGDVYEFRNEFTHWVTNNTLYDRITLIVCVTTSKEF
jgi:hypothetical protein